MMSYILIPAMILWYGSMLDLLCLHFFQIVIKTYAEPKTESDAEVFRIMVAMTSWLGPPVHW